MNIPTRTIPPAILISMTLLVLGAMFYASLFSLWVRKEMRIIPKEDTVAQEIFDTESEFSRKMQADRPLNFTPPNGAPSGVGPTYPPPIN